MTRALSAFLVLFGLIAPALAAPQNKDGDSAEAIDLLTQASKAVRRETYRGIIVYLRQGDVDTLKVVHRYYDHEEQERLISMSGQVREVIRKGDKVTSILPDHELVLVSEHPPKSMLGGMSHFSPKRLKANYQVVDLGTARTAGRDCRVIAIRPRDKFRYGYKMLIDSKTQLPLKLNLLHHGKRLEQMMFTDIAFPDHIPDSEFVPSYDVHGFRIVRHQAVHVSESASDKREEQWHATNLPPGFKLAEDGVRQLTSDASVRQMLFTDGVATVSAFIAPAGLRAPLKGATRMGAVHAYGDIVDDTQITVVGEVPAITARRIAQNLVQEKNTAKKAPAAND
ncbi:MucB/RseB C-terminal domain-containing protein [Salinisphaera sp.]|uniref:MucB/RseB C-terminal domain-containing protein n=1 Tax=Salinisphaera sp. TaxID=1914330 RepID=UPI002D78E014|nr:MucB/RseB C-terminal domain-containing protein [Salinisphaera sp.]HET7314865.1 MucB/RseB C-terminal domain-containing protein [Salinisphaera sp.]